MPVNFPAAIEALNRKVKMCCIEKLSASDH
jgi:hypothetical protein